MSSNFNSFIRRDGTLDRKEINKLVESLAEDRPSIEDEGGAVIYVSFMDELRIRTTSVSLNDGNFKMDELRDKETSAFLRHFSKNPASYPLTHTLVGTSPAFPTSGHMVGGGALFNDLQHIKIDHHSQIDNVLPFGLIISFKVPATSRHGKHVIFCKRDVSNDTNAGIEIWVDGNPVADYNSANFLAANYDTVALIPTVNIRISDGTNTVLFSEEVADLYDADKHTIAIGIQNESADYLAANFLAANYITIDGTQQIEVLVDKVSIGTEDISSITGAATNSRNAYIGGLDNAGTIQNTLAAMIAYLFIQSKIHSSAEVTSYHDANRINTDNEKTSIHFVGDESESSNTTMNS